MAADALKPELKRAAALLKMLGNPERLALVLLLRGGGQNLEELAQLLERQPAEISKHLAKLRAAGVAECTRYHRVLQYRLVSPTAEALLDILFPPGQEPEDKQPEGGKRGRAV